MPKQEMDWDSRYKLGDTPWDKGAPAPVIAWLLEKGQVPEAAGILVPGCGTGHDVARFATGGRRTLGLDISTRAITMAKKQYSNPNAEFRVGDLFDPECLQGKTFGLVWEHTCFCAIDPATRRDYVSAMHRLLKPGGSLIGLFFIDTQMPPGEGPPFETSRTEVVDLFSPRFTLVGEGEPSVCYPGREGREWLMQWQRGDD